MEFLTFQQWLKPLRGRLNLHRHVWRIVWILQEIAERYLSESRGLLTEGEAEALNLHRHCRDACQLVLLATRPWSRETRHLFPRRARARVRDLQVIARQIGNAPVNHQHAHALWDIWNSRVMAFAIGRED